ncbi:MAG: hypothetical protein WCT18_02240 [Patescibacteria group bacterium]
MPEKLTQESLEANRHLEKKERKEILRELCARMKAEQKIFLEGLARTNLPSPTINSYIIYFNYVLNKRLSFEESLVLYSLMKKLLQKKYGQLITKKPQGENKPKNKKLFFVQFDFSDLPWKESLFSAELLRRIRIFNQAAK